MVYLYFFNILCRQEDLMVYIVVSVVVRFVLIARVSQRYVLSVKVMYVCMFFCEMTVFVIFNN